MKQLGEPISTSIDGLNFIFKKKRKTIFNVIPMDERELTLIKLFDIFKELEECIRALELQTQKKKVCLKNKGGSTIPNSWKTTLKSTKVST